MTPKNNENGYPVDIKGNTLKDGDIIAEGKIGDKIWNDKAEITRRAIGIFTVYNNPNPNSCYTPERTDFYNIHQIRTGIAHILDKDMSSTFFNNEKDEIELYLTTYDGKFYGWDDIEIIGNIYDDFG